MNVAASPPTLASDAPGGNPASVDRFLTAWIEAVNDYLQRQYRHTVQKTPTEETVSRYRLECKWLLRFALELESVVKDPEYPGRQFEPEISGKLHQLQASWETLTNPISDKEADAVLQKAFPNEPRVGSPA